MFTLSRALWTDETGFIISSELVLIATVGVIGMTAALSCVRDSVTAELNDVAGAIGSLNQSYCYTGFSAASPRCCKSSTRGSCFTDHEEGSEISRVDIQGGAVIQATPARVIEKQAAPACPVEEAVPAVESAPVACPPASGAAVTLEAVVAACPSKPGAAATCATCNAAVACGSNPASTCDACGRNCPAPKHSIVTDCGELLHYSETRGEAVRLIDETDSLRFPKVTPTVSLW